MQRIVIVNVFGIILALAGPASAAPNDEVWFGGNARALRTSSANAVTGDDLGGAVLGYGRELIALGPRLALWAEAGMTIDSARGQMFQTLDTQLGVIDLTVGLRARYQVQRWLAASVRLDAGAQRTRLDVADASATTWGAMTQAALALELLAVSQPRIALGVRAELGYVRAQARSMALHTPTPGDQLLLPQMDAAIGDLDLSGPAFSVSLVGQF